jgi:hypothetical protein
MEEFMERLAALVPRLRLHLIRFHAVLAPGPSELQSTYTLVRRPVDPWGRRSSCVGAYLVKSGPVKVDTQELLRQLGSQKRSMRTALFDTAPAPW